MSSSTILYPILLQPHTTLSGKAEPASGADTKTLTILENMLATVYRANGIGLAAPQVDIGQRLVVMDLGVARDDGKRDFTIPKPQFFINPEIIWASEEMANRNEGCLSLPNVWGDVSRPATVRVRFTNRDGQVEELEMEGLDSACIQHEIDHLDGVLFTQRMSKIRRDIAMGKWAKVRKKILSEGTDFEVFAAEAGVIPAKDKDE